ncbi:MAG: hypothetical protein AB8B71_18210 [Paracoccaceae bacterium]
MFGQIATAEAATEKTAFLGYDARAGAFGGGVARDLGNVTVLMSISALISR